FLVHRRLTEPDEPRPPVHFAFDAPENLAFSSFDPVALSPDGRHVAFVTRSPDGGRMWIRSLDAPDARVLPGASGSPGGQFWSPAIASIAFPVKGELRKLSITGGAVQRICAFPREGFNKGTWSRQGTIVFSSGGPHGRLYSVSDRGGEAKPLTAPDASRDELFHHFAQFLPDDRHFLFQVSSFKEENGGLFAASLDAPAERRRIRPERVYFQFAAPGYLLFLQSGMLLAQRFDPKTLETTGEPVSLASSVASYAPGW